MSYARTTNSPFYAYWKSTEDVTRWQDEVVSITYDSEYQLKAELVDRDKESVVRWIVPDNSTVQNQLNSWYGRTTEEIRDRLRKALTEFLGDVKAQWGVM